jgi:hypothetical protein
MKLIKHLKQRGMDPKLYSFARSYSASTVTFYLWNLSGQLVGYQQYRPNKTSKRENNPRQSRYFTKMKEKDGVFGLELLDPCQSTIYIVEGVFKAAVLHRLGYNALAVLTNHPKRLKPWFRILRAQGWNLVAIGDNDAAGQKLVNTVRCGFLSPQDLDEMKDEDIFSLLGAVRNR